MRFRFMLAGIAAGVATGFAVSEARQWRRTWGVDPDETTRVMPGDDVVGEPVASETRGITIAATPDRIWPWLVQMGFGKAGWYSYDQLDQRGASSDEIVEAWGAIKVGDIMPTHPPSCRRRPRRGGSAPGVERRKGRPVASRRRARS